MSPLDESEYDDRAARRAPTAARVADAATSAPPADLPSVAPAPPGSADGTRPRRARPSRASRRPRRTPTRRRTPRSSYPPESTEAPAWEPTRREPPVWRSAGPRDRAPRRARSRTRTLVDRPNPSRRRSEYPPSHGRRPTRSHEASDGTTAVRTSTPPESPGRRASGRPGPRRRISPGADEPGPARAPGRAQPAGRDRGGRGPGRRRGRVAVLLAAGVPRRARRRGRHRHLGAGPGDPDQRGEPAADPADRRWRADDRPGLVGAGRRAHVRAVHYRARGHGLAPGRRRRRVRADVTSATLVAVYLPFLAGVRGHAGQPRPTGTCGWWSTLAGVVLSDTGGYVAGVLFGKHPMAPSVSPKKSWEGLVGSLLATASAAPCCCTSLSTCTGTGGPLFGLAVVGRRGRRRPGRIHDQAGPRGEGHEQPAARPRRLHGSPGLDPVRRPDRLRAARGPRPGRLSSCGVGPDHAAYAAQIRSGDRPCGATWETGRP